MSYEEPRKELQDLCDKTSDPDIRDLLRWTIATLDTMQDAIQVLLYTVDNIRPTAAMTVYGVSPLNEVETLYVEDCLYYASTCFPTENMGASICRFPIIKCYANKEMAEYSAAMRSAAIDDALGMQGDIDG